MREESKGMLIELQAKCKNLEQERDQLLARVAELEARLKPFAVFHCGCGACNNCLADKALNRTEPQSLAALEARVLRDVLCKQFQVLSDCGELMMVVRTSDIKKMWEEAKAKGDV